MGLFFARRAYFHLYLGKMQGTLRGVEPSVAKPVGAISEPGAAAQPSLG